MLFSHAYFSGAHLPFSVALWWKDMVAVRVVAFAVFSWDDEVKEKERGLNCFPHLVFNSSVKRRICFCVMIKGHVHYYFSRAVFVSPVCFVIPFLLISKHSFFCGFYFVFGSHAYISVPNCYPQYISLVCKWWLRYLKALQLQSMCPSGHPWVGRRLWVGSLSGSMALCFFTLLHIFWSWCLRWTKGLSCCRCGPGFLGCKGWQRPWRWKACLLVAWSPGGFETSEEAHVCENVSLQPKCSAAFCLLLVSLRLVTTHCWWECTVIQWLLFPFEAFRFCLRLSTMNCRNYVFFSSFRKQKSPFTNLFKLFLKPIFSQRFLGFVWGGFFLHVPLNVNYWSHKS